MSTASGAAPALAPEVLRATFGCAPSGVVAVCALVDGRPDGMAASSFTPVSLDPPLVTICAARASATWSRLRVVPRLGLSMLAAEHGPLCRRLAARTGDRFTGVRYEVEEAGAVRVLGAAAHLSCQLTDELPAGDHVIAVLQVVALEADHACEPLVFHRSRFRTLASTR